MTEKDFITAMTKLAIQQGPDPHKWTFGTLKRQGLDGTGPFLDAEICELITKGTEAVAGAFKGRGSPACMRQLSRRVSDSLSPIDLTLKVPQGH